MSGSGTSYLAAKNDAFRKAIETAFGVQMQVDTKVLDYNIVSDIVFSRAEGFILEYRGERIIKQVATEENYFTAFYSEVVVSTSARKINERILAILAIFRNFHCPALGLNLDNCAESFHPYIKSLIINVLQKDIEKDYELLVIPYIKAKASGFTLYGQLEDKKGNVLAVTQPTTFSLDSGISKLHIAQLMLVNLFLTFKEYQKYILIIQGLPNIAMAEKVRHKLHSLSIVSNCVLKRFSKEARYYIWSRVALATLALRIEQLFGKVVFDEPSRTFMARWSEELNFADKRQSVAMSPDPDLVTPTVAPVNPSPEIDVYLAGQYLLHFAYFADLEKLQNSYQAIKELANEKIVIIQKTMQPNGKNILVKVYYRNSIGALSRELEKLFRRHGLNLSYDIQKWKIIITEP